MSRSTSVILLVLAATLEAGGDALFRRALQSSAAANRAVLFALGGCLLLGYGYTVNAPPWHFGRLLGLYVVIFFVIAQGISWLVFHQPPSGRVMIGGAFIVTGGLVIALGQT